MNDSLYQSLGHVVVFFSLMALAAISARAPSRVDVARGSRVIEYPAALKMVTWFFDATFGFMFVLAAMSTRGPSSTPLWLVLAALAVLTACLALTIDVTKTSVSWTDHELVQVSPWRGEQRILWSDVTKMTYSGINRWFVLESRMGVTIRVHYLLSGIPEFLAFARERLDPTVYEGALDGFDWHA